MYLHIKVFCKKDGSIKCNTIIFSQYNMIITQIVKKKQKKKHDKCVNDFYQITQF